MQNWADIEIVYQGLKSKEQAATIIHIQDMKQLSPPEFSLSNQIQVAPLVHVQLNSIIS